MQGTVVVLTVSKAPDQVSVPDVTGQTGDAAKATPRGRAVHVRGHRHPRGERRCRRQHRDPHRPGCQHAGRQGIEGHARRVERTGKGQGSAGRRTHRGRGAESVDATRAGCRRAVRDRRDRFARRWPRDLAEHSADRVGATRYDDPAQGRQGSGGADDHDHVDDASPDDDSTHRPPTCRSPRPAASRGRR